MASIAEDQVLITYEPKKGRLEGRIFEIVISSKDREQLQKARREGGCLKYFESETKITEILPNSEYYEIVPCENQSVHCEYEIIASRIANGKFDSMKIHGKLCQGHKSGGYHPERYKIKKN